MPSISISYMGTKRRISSFVRDAASLSSPGPFLDLFSGICAVGEVIAPSRQVWSNDAQIFSAYISKMLFCSEEDQHRYGDVFEKIRSHYNGHVNKLGECFSAPLKQEAKAIKQQDIERLNGLCRHTAFSRAYDINYSLFTRKYAGTYIGIEQSITLDALRYAIDKGIEDRSISNEEKIWACVALGQALSKVSTSTGHFAQYQTANPNNIDRYSRQRQRNMLVEFEKAFDTYHACRTKTWRKGNKAFNGSALKVLSTFDSKRAPKLVYADPPYTKDQYSRYYHLLETLVRYDNPSVFSKARYRSRRFVSNFCLKNKVQEEMYQLIHRASRVGADIVLTYPSNGVLENSTTYIMEALRKKYKKAELLFEIELHHSSMGGSKGAANGVAKEFIFWGGHQTWI